MTSYDAINITSRTPAHTQKVLYNSVYKCTATDRHLIIIIYLVQQLILFVYDVVTVHFWHGKETVKHSSYRRQCNAT